GLHSSQHLESQNRQIGNPLRFHQAVNRSSDPHWATWGWLATTVTAIWAVFPTRGGMAGTARVNPDYSLEYRRKVLPYKNPADIELTVDGLRKAGIVQ
ncbi:hypothetical protein NKI87_10790, partial [Mesorhizobium sp. M0322]